ncbi:MAG: hypothetical protein BECKG1743D_GA0114223_101486 [Candidatus Kentron sp. G]|nr:MAG: hypothetical protein BECKG1743F_GA0114225_101026 [Candidatus Kentron sp. G]VFM96854.1 MAG: hypothetical protein BECKG1743E_GA0114224_100946 [Candidatus Kentron sp. G]VFM99813.1 MAG: hypothetical protein BECKG1743D_GA0114223_101486 [Candidatus Kentron sp. G]
MAARQTAFRNIRSPSHTGFAVLGRAQFPKKFRKSQTRFFGYV